MLPRCAYSIPLCCSVNERVRLADITIICYCCTDAQVKRVADVLLLLLLRLSWLLTGAQQLINHTLLCCPWFYCASMHCVYYY
jgi:hypothetical protein